MVEISMMLAANKAVLVFCKSLEFSTTKWNDVENVANQKHTATAYLMKSTSATESRKSYSPSVCRIDFIVLKTSGALAALAPLSGSMVDIFALQAHRID